MLQRPYCIESESRIEGVSMFAKNCENTGFYHLLGPLSEGYSQ